LVARSNQLTPNGLVTVLQSMIKTEWVVRSLKLESKYFFFLFMFFFFSGLSSCWRGKRHAAKSVCRNGRSREGQDGFRNWSEQSQAKQIQLFFFFFFYSFHSGYVFAASGNTYIFSIINNGNSDIDYRVMHNATDTMVIQMLNC
jgi:hypothetical protein